MRKATSSATRRHAVCVHAGLLISRRHRHRCWRRWVSLSKVYAIAPRHKLTLTIQRPCQMATLTIAMLAWRLHVHWLHARTWLKYEIKARRLAEKLLAETDASSLRAEEVHQESVELYTHRLRVADATNAEQADRLRVADATNAEQADHLRLTDATNAKHAATIAEQANRLRLADATNAKHAATIAEQANRLLLANATNAQQSPIFKGVVAEASRWRACAQEGWSWARQDLERRHTIEMLEARIRTKIMLPYHPEANEIDKYFAKEAAKFAKEIAPLALVTSSAQDLTEGTPAPRLPTPGYKARSPSEWLSPLLPHKASSPD